MTQKISYLNSEFEKLYGGNKNIYRTKNMASKLKRVNCSVWPSHEQKSLVN